MDLKGRSFLKLLDFTSEEIEYLIDYACQLKQMKKIRLFHDKSDSLNDSCKFTSNSKDKKSYGKGTSNSNENITSNNTIVNKLLINDNSGDNQ